MPNLRGLTILVATADPDRFHAALSLAAAQAALGGRARIYLHAEAVALLGRVPEDDAHPGAGMPGIADLRAEAAALGVTLTACQSGLALARLSHGQAGHDVEVGGLIGLLSDLGDDRLVAL
jgi:predicted peroxiredoxin